MVDLVATAGSKLDQCGGVSLVFCRIEQLVFWSCGTDLVAVGTWRRRFQECEEEQGGGDSGDRSSFAGVRR